MSRLLRYRCNKCNKVMEFDSATFCPQCGSGFVNNEGLIQIYRMGTPLAMAVGFGIYINGVPFGHLGNTESTRIPLPFGTYTLHFTCGMIRKCEDLVVTLTPQNPIAFVKTKVKAGFWTNSITTQQVNGSDMPPV